MSSSYLGSKGGDGVWQRIAAEIPPHDLLIVPFAGQCALSRKLQPAPKRLLFDLDVRVCDFWDDVQQRDDADLACYNQNGIEYLEAIVSACDSEELMAFPKWAAPEFESQVEQLEWVDQRVVIYCDPPYLVSTRTSAESRYRHDMTDAEHERLLSVIRRLPCRVIISGYDSQLYRERLSDWRLVTFNATTRGKSKVRTECLWSNREQPSVTHMPVMVGTDKRQREKLKRRHERIEAKAARIAPSDVQQWLTCLSRRTDATAASPVPTPPPSERESGIVTNLTTLVRRLARNAKSVTLAEQAMGYLDRTNLLADLSPLRDVGHLEAATPETAAAAAEIGDARADLQKPVVTTPAAIAIDESRDFSSAGGVSSVTRDLPAVQPQGARHAESWQRGNVLSLFTGLGLLDEAFRREGYTVDSAGDVMWGSPIERYRGTRSSHVGVIAGVPCQTWSAANPSRVPISQVDLSATSSHEGVRTCRELLRVIDEIQPRWWLVECVPGVPDLALPGYHVQRLNLTDVECGGTQRRLRSIQFGTLEEFPLIIRPQRIAGRRASEPCVLASQCREPESAFERRCRTMGLQSHEIPDLSAFTKAARFRLIGNGVPLTMGRVLASAVIGAGPSTEQDCLCGCGQQVRTGSRYSANSNATCRKRYTRRLSERFVIELTKGHCD